MVLGSNAHISVLKGALWDKEQMHCGICELGQFQKTTCGSQALFHLHLLYEESTWRTYLLWWIILEATEIEQL